MKQSVEKILIRQVVHKFQDRGEKKDPGRPVKITFGEKGGVETSPRKTYLVTWDDNQDRLWGRLALQPEPGCGDIRSCTGHDKPCKNT